MNIEEQYFTCKKCGESKIWGEFRKNQKTKYGILYNCKACYRKTRDPKIEAERYKINKERIQQQCARYYQINKERIKKKVEEYWLKKMQEEPDVLREKGRVRTAKWRVKNRDKVLLRDREWRKANRDKALIYEKAYRAKYPIKTAEKWKRKRISATKRLATSYVKACLVSRGFSRSQADQNPELINIQRIIIQTKRLCKT